MRCSNNAAAFLCCLAVGALVAACGASDPRTPQQLLNEGTKAWRGGQTAEAEKLLRTAVERAIEAGIDKHTLRMYHGRLFALYASENRLAEAESAYEGVETTQDFMINPAAGHNLGLLRMRAGKNAEAEKILKATQDSLATTSGPEDERPLALMVSVHRDLASLALDPRDADAGADVVSRIDDLLRFQGGRNPYLHPALVHELALYADRLKSAGRGADAEAVRDRVRAQQARGTEPGTTTGECLLLGGNWPEGCILGLELD